MSARDADWRFLLPGLGRPIEHMLLLGGTRELEATVLELGVAQRVSSHIDPGDRYDAAIILSDARPALVGDRGTPERRRGVVLGNRSPHAAAIS